MIRRPPSSTLFPSTTLFRSTLFSRFLFSSSSPLDLCASTTVCASTANVGTSLTAVVNVKESALGYPSHRRGKKLIAAVLSSARARLSGGGVMKKRLNDRCSKRKLRVKDEAGR